MKIALSTDSSVDLTNKTIKDNDIHVVPFGVTLGDKTYKDGKIKLEQIFEYVSETKTLPKTSAVNVNDFLSHFGKLKEEYDAVIHVSFSSELSSAYNNAVTASKEFDNVKVIDSKSLSTGVALLVLYARKLIDNGESIDNIVEKVNERTPYVQASFALKRVDYLYKGGRCSALSLLGANLLKIRPQILVEGGKMVSGRKYRGKYDYVVKTYCQDILEKFDNPDLDAAFITYTTASEEILSYTKELLLDRGFKKVYVTRAGATIASHCGEDCLGILFINDGLNS